MEDLNLSISSLRHIQQRTSKSDETSFMEGAIGGGMGTRICMYLLLYFVTPCSVTYAGGGDAILGIWNNQEKDAQIEIYKCGEKFCGRIVWLKEPNYPEGSDEGLPGTPRVDHNNPEPELRKTPVIGLQILNNLAFAGGNSWQDGKIYDPRNGKTYRAGINLISDNKLNLRGFIGISLIGRTAVWTR